MIASVTVAAVFPSAMKPITASHWKTSPRAATTEMVNERYRFTDIGNSAMRFVSALGVVLAGLSVIGAVTVYAQMDKHSQHEGTSAAVVDDKGNLRAPSR